MPVDCHIQASLLHQRHHQDAILALRAAESLGLITIYPQPYKFHRTPGSIGYGNVDFMLTNFPTRYLSPWASFCHGRKVWSKDRGDLMPTDGPYFFKPRYWKQYPSGIHDSPPHWAHHASEIIHFVEEYRTYVSHGDILATRFYLDLTGNAQDELPCPWAGQFGQLSCAFDWGLTDDGRYLPVENHPPFSIGLYTNNPALDAVWYVKFLQEGHRWMEAQPTHYPEEPFASQAFFP